MSKITILYYTLWIAHPVLLLGLAALLVWRKLHFKFRFFSGYVLTQLATFAALFPAYYYKQNYEACFYLYWVFNAISVAFGFGVIYEIFVDVFRSFHTLRDLGTVLFKWAGLVMLLVAGVVSVSNGSSQVEPWMDAIMTAQRCVRIIQVGMVLFLLFFAHYLGVSRRQHSFGIALGFGAYAALELALLASFVGEHMTNPWMSIINMTAYNISLLIWVGYIFVKSPAQDATQSLLQTQRWEHSLSNIHNPLPADSLIPMFEGMVDRALSRTQPDVTSGEPATKTRGAAASNGGFQLPIRIVSRG